MEIIIKIILWMFFIFYAMAVGTNANYKCKNRTENGDERITLLEMLLLFGFTILLILS
jgi:hypothetical protein